MPITPSLITKANDADVVHKTGDESIYGNKTFVDTVIANNISGTNTGDQDLSNYATIEDINKLKSLSVAMSIALG